MNPGNDPQLTELLQEWQVPGAPPSLDARVFGAPGKWWRFLLTGSISLPVPIAVVIAAILLLMAVTLIRRNSTPPAPSSVDLADFRPVQDLNVRVIRGHYDPQ